MNEPKVTDIMFKFVECEAVPSGTVYLISPRYLPTGELDIEATAKASAMVTNVAPMRKRTI